MAEVDQGEYPCIRLEFHRGPTLTGRAYCGRSIDKPTRIVTVLITDQRDPMWTPATSMVFDEGEWLDGTPKEVLEGFAMIRIAQRKFYLTTPG